MTPPTSRSRKRRIFFRLFDADGYAPSIGSLDSNVVLLYVPTGAGAVNSQVKFRQLNAQLFYVKETPLTAAISSPMKHRETSLVLAGTSYFASWVSVGETTGSLHVAGVTPTADITCGPTSSNEFAADAALGGSGQVKLARFGADCVAMPSIDVVGTNVVPVNGFTALGGRSDVAVGDKIAVVWDERQGGDGRISGRIFGKKFCD